MTVGREATRAGPGGAAASSGLAVGVDVGGTKVGAGLVAADGTLVSRIRRETPAESAEQILDLVVDCVEELTRVVGVERLPVGVGAAGMIDLAGTMRYAPNIDWADFPLGPRLEKRLGVRVAIENDANAAAWGEYCQGAGHGVDHGMLMLTLGTGVGGGLVEDGRLVRGANGLGAEFGHIILSEGGPRCGCGNRGCLEALASGSAIGRVAAEALTEGRVPAGSRLHDLDEVTGKTVTITAHAGDPYAAEVLQRCGFWLGVGIASLVNALDPALVVIGGGAMQAGDLLLGPARAAYLERLIGRVHRATPDIVRAQLGDEAGIIGAALLAMDDGAPVTGFPG